MEIDQTFLYGDGDTSFRAAGGEAGIRRLVEAFYAHMDTLPEAEGIRRLHPESLDVSIDKLARFLCGWLGGPPRYNEKYGTIVIPSAHAHLPVGASERDAWLACMERAIAEQPYEAAFARYLRKQLGVPAERIREVCEAQRHKGSLPSA